MPCTISWTSLSVRGEMHRLFSASNATSIASGDIPRLCMEPACAKRVVFLFPKGINESASMGIAVGLGDTGECESTIQAKSERLYDRSGCFSTIVTGRGGAYFRLTVPGTRRIRAGAVDGISPYNAWASP